VKRRLLLLPALAFAILACQQLPTTPQVQTLGGFEVAFDLDKKTVQAMPKLQAQTVLTPSQISFTQGTLGLLSDVSSGVNYISATFNVNNLTSNALQNVTLVAYQKSGNRADTALKSLVDFNGTPLTPAQLDGFARAVQPINMPSSVAPFVVNNNIADLQYWDESELAFLEANVTNAGEINQAGGEYLFPYGFVARSSNTSRSIAVGNNQGTVTVALKLPNSNEPSGTTSSSYPRRFSMTFVVVAQSSSNRLTESYEERRGTSSAATRATNFGIASSNIARNSAANPSSGLQINGVRTAGSQTNVQHLLGERAWQLGTSLYDGANGVATDSSGNVYVTGQTFAGLDGNANAGSLDAFLSKYNSNGVKIWTRQPGTTGAETGTGVATDSNLNVYITGYTTGGLDGNISAGGNDLFLSKYFPNGSLQWTRQLGTSSDDIATSVTTDNSGNVYVAGYTRAGLDGQTFVGGFYDLFITKYNASGTKQWTRQLGSTGDDYANGITTDSSGNVYVTGATTGGLDGNTSAGLEDIFITKYNASGTKQWTRQLGTTRPEFGRGIVADVSGDIYVTGYTFGSLDGNTVSGFNDAFLSKYDANGVKQWTRLLGASSNDFAYAVTAGTTGGIYLTGETNGNLGSASAGGSDLFVARYDTSGVRTWVRQVGTSGADYGFGIATDPSGNIYAAGNTEGGFGGVSNAGSEDVLLIRFDALTDLYK
jgi:hypothetical protein